MKKPGKARFWFMTPNGEWVRISLRDKEHLIYSTGGPNEEGYHFVTVTFSRICEVVYVSEESSSRDCDGRFDTSDTRHCPVSRLKTRDNLNPATTDDPMFLPEWELESRGQRDYSAEAAGY